MHHYGQVFRELRKRKKYSLKKIAGPEVSIAQISRFERGESELSLSKFLYALNQLQISIADFSDKVALYKDSDSFPLILELDALDGNYQLDDLKRLHRLEGKKLEKAPDNLSLKLNNIIISALLSHIREWYKPSQEDLNLASDYLLDTAEWGGYELTLVNSLFPYFKSSLVKKLGTAIVKYQDFYQFSISNRKLVTKTLLNIYQYYLEKQDLRTAGHFEKALLKVLETDQMLDERMTFHYLNALQAHLQGKKTGKKQMKDLLDAWKQTGANKLYDKYLPVYKNNVSA